jgi:hypothetical protein
MPKPPKTSNQQKQKYKPKAELEAPGITTKKSYWIMLLTLLTLVSAVFGVVLGLGLLRTSFLVVTVVVLVGFLGFIRIKPSSLSVSKRATFIFVGASVIGFSIWAAIMLFFMQQIVELNDSLLVIFSLAVFLTIGAFIGELIGRDHKVQEWFFPQNL